MSTIDKGVAAIFKDNKFSDKVNGFKITEFRVMASARVIGSPVESGFVAIDNKVVDPMRVTVGGVIQITDDEQNVNDALTSIEQMMASRDEEFYSVTDGIQTIGNLVLESYNTSHVPERIDWLSITLNYKKVSDAMLSSKSTGRLSNVFYASMTDLGYIQGTSSLSS